MATAVAIIIVVMLGILFIGAAVVGLVYAVLTFIGGLVGIGKGVHKILK